MLGRTDRQLSFADLWLANKISADSYYALMNKWVRENLTDDMFQQLYSHYGRPSESPIYLFAAIMIQLEKGLSDSEIEGSTRFDDRVKYAITAPRNFDGIDAVTLCEFRQKLFKSDLGREIFINILKQAKEAKMFSENNLNVIDAFMINGSTTRQSTYKMIYMLIKKVLKICEFYGFKESAMKVLKRSDYELDLQKPKIRWDDKEEKTNLINDLAEDAYGLINYVKTVIKPEYKDLVYTNELLEKVVIQDIEMGNDNKYKIIEGTAKDRIITINDTEMRHGRKTSAKLHNGYKGEIITGGEKGDLVIATNVMPANVPDGTEMGKLIDQAKENGEEIEKLYGDSAYNDGEEINKRKNEIEIVAKVPGAVNKNGFYTKDDFKIDMQNGKIECPAEKIVYFNANSIPENGKTIFFTSKNCDECNKKNKCTKSKNGRTVCINPDEEEIIEIKKFQKTEEFREDYAKRSNGERTISELTKHGARQGRFIGVAKTRFQLLLVSINHNIKKVMRYINNKSIVISTG